MPQRYYHTECLACLAANKGRVVAIPTICSDYTRLYINFKTKCTLQADTDTHSTLYMVLLSVHLLQDRNEVCSCLPRAILSSGQNVLACQSNGDRLLLNW